jgi:ElaB/YqjD/DUF883 family membrane-anchored ribosome-binding protein
MATAGETVANGAQALHRALPKKLRKSLRTVQDDFGALGNDVAQLASTVGDEAKGQIHHAAQSARHGAEGAITVLQERVREKPGVALGLAAGAGVLLGLLLAGRR